MHAHSLTRLVNDISDHEIHGMHRLCCHRHKCMRPCILTDTSACDRAYEHQTETQVHTTVHTTVHTVTDTSAYNRVYEQ